MSNKKRVIFHGEVAFFEVENIPTEAKEVSINNNYFVVGESETHGNDHRIAVDDRTNVFIVGDQLFLKSIGTEIYCPNDYRHTTIDLPAGNWQIGHAVEADHLSESLRRVRD